MNDCLIIGVGNPQRGDDGVGLAAARLVRAALPDADVRESAGDPADLIELWTTTTAPTVYVIDAM
ncbi:MAG: hydrogenase maturation protease, partial [Anaerolineae bacterium]|nr:hydrogenase maturation protease [Anaerolineae bacterium]